MVSGRRVVRLGGLQTNPGSKLIYLMLVGHKRHLVPPFFSYVYVYVNVSRVPDVNSHPDEMRCWILKLDE